MHNLTTPQDRQDNHGRTSGAMDLDAVATVFRRNMATLVTERATRRQTRPRSSHVPAA